MRKKVLTRPLPRPSYGETVDREALHKKGFAFHRTQAGILIFVPRKVSKKAKIAAVQLLLGLA